MPQLQFSVDWGALVGLNVERVRAGMAERGIDLLVVNDADNVRYLTGYSTVVSPGFHHVTWAVLGRSGPPVLLALSFYVRSIERGLPWVEDVRPLPASVPGAVQEIASDLGVAGGTIGLGGGVGFAVGREVERLLPSASVVPADELLAAARMVKSPLELQVIRRAVAVAEIGMAAGIAACEEGVMEYEAAAAAEHAMRRAGAEGVPYSAIVTGGENAAWMQEISSDRFLRNGELVMLDLGCVYEGYCAEFARSVVVGGRPTEEQRRVYHATYEALRAVVAAVRPGVSCDELDAIPRRILTERGYGEHLFDYFVGHGIGMGVWEPPLALPGNETTLEPGMVINLEPGVHRPGLGGLRLEDTVLVTETGHEVLTRTAFWNEVG